MSTTTPASPTQHQPEIDGQTIVVIGGSAGIGLETARLARAKGAELILIALQPGSVASRRRRGYGAKVSCLRRHRLRTAQEVLR